MIHHPAPNRVVLVAYSLRYDTARGQHQLRDGDAPAREHESPRLDPVGLAGLRRKAQRADVVTILAGQQFRCVGLTDQPDLCALLVKLTHVGQQPVSVAETIEPGFLSRHIEQGGRGFRCGGELTTSGQAEEFVRTINPAHVFFVRQRPSASVTGGHPVKVRPGQSRKPDPAMAPTGLNVPCAGIAADLAPAGLEIIHEIRGVGAEHRQVVSACHTLHPAAFEDRDPETGPLQCLGYRIPGRT